jgi:SAM-dependent methyltransferase
VESTVRAETIVAAPPEEVRAWVAEALADAGIALEDGALEHRLPWQPDGPIRVEVHVEPAGEGASRVIVEQQGLGPLLGDPGDVAGWFAERVAAPLLRAGGPAAMGDWLTDRRARRPAGPQARAVYRDPTYHRPNFRAILDVLAPTADDVLLEVGCGGGALLADVLATGCRAAAVDHSADMVRLARAVNREAVEAGRLDVRHANADELPFAEAMFTCAAMTGVLGFLPRPVAALAEIRRVLRPGGRLALFTGSPEMRGTVAAPEPMASRLHFYDDDALAALARDAGFADVAVDRPDLGRFARAEEMPELSPDDLEVFSRMRGQLLTATR